MKLINHFHWSSEAISCRDFIAFTLKMFVVVVFDENLNQEKFVA
jgi:hypothetical protein